MRPGQAHASGADEHRPVRGHVPAWRLRFAGILGAAFLAWMVPGPLPAASRPNIILLESDDHHFEALGCMGGPVQTPYLDGLAARGMLFRNNVCQGTACSPSRNALLTGSYPHNTGIYYNQDGNLPEGVWTFPQALQRAGYLTALIGKNHFKPPSGVRPRDRTLADARRELEGLGFEHIHAIAGKVSAATAAFVPGQDPYRDYLHERGLLEKLRQDYERRRGPEGMSYHAASVLPVEHYQDTYIANRTIDFIREHDRRRPFFVWVDFVAPHPPADAPEPYASLYDWRKMPDRIPPAPGEVLRGRRRISEEDLKKFKAGYYGMVTLLDAQVGRIVEALERTGQLENTIVVFAGDQGSMLGDHGHLGKSVFYKGSVNSPLIVAGPGVTGRGKAVERPVELIGLAATFLQLAGAAPEDIAQCRSESLLPLLTGRGDYGRRYAFAEEWDTKMVVDERYKFIEEPGKVILFDLKNDPQERTNLAGTLPAVEKRLKQAIADHLAATPPVRKPSGVVRKGGRL
jgi:arylsulfatase A-like enzyme